MKKFVSIILCLLLTAEMGFGNLTTAREVNASGEKFSVHFIDVGCGDGALLQYGSGTSAKYALIDAGPRYYNRSDGKSVYVGNQVLDYLKERNVTKLEFAIMTHPHGDHIGGFISLLADESIEIGTMYSPVSLEGLEGTQKSDFLEVQGNAYSSASIRKVCKAIRERNIPVVVPKLKQTIYLGGARVSFLAPAASSYVYGKGVDLATRQINKCSIVCRIVYGKNSFLMTGDIQKESVQAMVNKGIYLKSQVMKQPHHGYQDVRDQDKKGDYNSDHKYIIDRVQPTMTIISNGYKNADLVPHQRVLRDLARTNTYLTSNKGDIVVTSNGTTLSTWTQRNGSSPTYKRYDKSPYKTKIKANVKGIKTLNTKTKTKKVKSYKKKVKLSFQAEFGRAGKQTVQYKVVPKGKSSQKYRWKNGNGLTYKKKKAVTVYVKFTNRVGKSTIKKTNKFKVKKKK